MSIRAFSGFLQICLVLQSDHLSPPPDAYDISSSLAYVSKAYERVVLSNLPYVRRVAYFHVGVGVVIQWPWEAYHQNHNSAGILADI
jgi:hypothetical protein